MTGATSRGPCSRTMSTTVFTRSSASDADTQLDAILASDIQDTHLTLKPRKVDPNPRPVRIVRAPRSDWVLLTTLVDVRTYPAQGLADLYHQRWSIEELYKTIKQTLSMEAFHAQSLRGVQQELSAGMTLIALARLMTNDCERLINDHRHTRGGLLANQKNALSAVHDGFEAMLLGFATSCATFVRTTIARIADCMQPRSTSITVLSSVFPEADWQMEATKTRLMAA